MKIQLDMYQTLAVAVLVLMLGSFLRRRISFLEKFCIPAPVIGGLLFAIMTCIGHVSGIADFSFDDTGTPIKNGVLMGYTYTEDDDAVSKVAIESLSLS